ncbi:MAG: geranylgeranyl reductase family protein [Acidimicrobiia bacterium]|nr:geranylgeranyl reductase family protein [Acidimicrobiia bacterium]
MSSSPQVLVVGGGPGGASAAFWLAKRGVDVTMVEKKRYPREKACGDGLTPRAVRQLVDMGFDFDRPDVHRVVGLRSYAGDVMLEMPWPEHSVYPNWGATLRRADLDGRVAALAEAEGATVLEGVEAVAVVGDGDLTAVELRRKGEETEVATPDYVVVADGSLSRFGRKLGAARRRDYPFGLAVRGYWESPNSTDGYIESQLDIRDREGRAMPGYGWVFPMGDGTINVGAGLVSTFKGWKDINTSEILEAYLAELPDHWHIGEDSIARPIGGKLPMAFSVGPKTGRNWVLVGDAAGAVNPFNGEGIDYAYETGRLAAGFISEALATGDPTTLAAYDEALVTEYAAYHRVARIFVSAIGNPSVMRTLTTVGLRSRPLMEWVLKVMANLLEPEERGMAEKVYVAIEKAIDLPGLRRIKA